MFQFVVLSVIGLTELNLERMSVLANLFIIFELCTHTSTIYYTVIQFLSAPNDSLYMHSCTHRYVSYIYTHLYISYMYTLIQFIDVHINIPCLIRCTMVFHKAEVGHFLNLAMK